MFLKICFMRYLSPCCLLFVKIPFVIFFIVSVNFRILGMIDVCFIKAVIKGEQILCVNPFEIQRFLRVYCHFPLSVFLFSLWAGIETPHSSITHFMLSSRIPFQLAPSVIASELWLFWNHRKKRESCIFVTFLTL